MMTKKQAERAGRALLKKMHGTQWKLRVWENLGWHYSVETINLSVSPCSDTMFHCLLHPHYTFFGKAGESRNPNRAVRQTLATAKQQMAEYYAIVNQAEQEANS